MVKDVQDVDRDGNSNPKYKKSPQQFVAGSFETAIKNIKQSYDNALGGTQHAVCLRKGANILNDAIQNTYSFIFSTRCKHPTFQL